MAGKSAKRKVKKPAAGKNNDRFMQTSRWWRVAITVSLLAVLIAVSLVMLLSRGIDKELHHISTTAVLRQQTDLALLNLIEMDTAERIFSSTHNSEHYQHFFHASQALDQAMASINTIAKDYTRWHNRTAELYQGIDERRKLLTHRLMASHQTPSKQARQLTTDSAAMTPSQLTQLITSFITEEEQELAKRRQGLDLLRTGQTFTALIAIISAFVLAYAVVNRFQRDVRRLRNNQSMLYSANVMLEQRVKDRTAELEAARAHAEKERQRVESLLQDSSHRIGNSLATVSSLLGLQLQRSRNSEVRAALTSARDRIQTISAAHRRLRLGEDMETASAGDFFNAVVHDVQTGLSADQRERIRFRTHFEAWHLASRDVTTLGIILGELLTNAVKHAFPKGKSGVIDICFGKTDDDTLQLLVEDNGIGFTDTEEDPAEHQGLGRLVISKLCMQFGEQPRFERGKKRGTRVIIPLPALAADKIANEEEASAFSETLVAATAAGS